MSNESRILAAQIERAMDDESTVERQITRYHFLKDFEALAGLASALQSALAAEREAREKAEVTIKQFDQLTDELTKGYGAASCINPVTDMRNAISKVRGLLKAAEARIKASQEQEPYQKSKPLGASGNPVADDWVGYYESIGCPHGRSKTLYEYPPIPPDVAELQRQLEEAKRVPEFELELPDGDERKVKVWFVEKRSDGKWHISMTVDKQTEETK